jgi:8-oxo-dGTP diphosphatase
MKKTSEYTKPSLATDLVIFAYNKGSLEVLLIQRKNDPFKDSWALPGGFLDENETTEACAARELNEETGLKVANLNLVGVYSKPNRDPRSRVVSVAYTTFIAKPKYALKAQDDASNLQWLPLSKIPKLAFDHDQIVNDAFEKLKNESIKSPIGYGVLEEPFALDDLHTLYESIQDQIINIKTFQRRVMKLKFIVRNNSTNKFDRKTVKLYNFDLEVYKDFQRKGFILDFNEK